MKKNYFIRIIQELPPKARNLALLIVIFSVINALVELAFVAFIATVITKLLVQSTQSFGGVTSQILGVFGISESDLSLKILLSAVMISFFWRVSFLYFSIDAAKKIGVIFSYVVYEKIIFLKNTTVYSLPDIATIITNKINSIVNGIIITTFTIIISAFTLIVLSVIFILSAGSYSFLGLILLIFGYSTFYYFLRIKAERKSKILSSSVIKAASIVMNVFENRAILLITRVYNRSRLNKSFADVDLAAKQSVASIRIYQDLARPFFELFVNLIIILLALNIDGRTEISSDWVLIAVGITRLIPYFQNAYRALITYRGSVGSADIVLSLLDEGIDAEKNYTNVMAQKYSDPDQIRLIGKSLVIKPGEKRIEYPDFELCASNGMYIITGPSGSGKSSLINAICGLVDFEGTLNLDYSTNIRPENAIGLCLQNVWLYKGTVKQNLEVFLGVELNKEKLQRANYLLRKTGLISNNNESVASNILHKYIGDNGQGLSGGEIKRLGIVRALLTDPKLLIIDEPTSGLDADTAQGIGELLEELSQQLIVLIITHDHNISSRGKLLLNLTNG